VWRYLSEHMNVRQFKEQVSRKGAKAQRKSLFFAPLRALRETSFFSNNGITRIPRNISTRTDLCITARVPAWEPLSCKLLFDRSSGSLSFKNPIPKRESLGTSKKSRHTGRDCRYPEHREVKLRAENCMVYTAKGGLLPSMATGCIRDIHVPHPSGGEAVQIGCPADLSGNPCRNDEPSFTLWLKMRIAAVCAVTLQRG